MRVERARERRADSIGYNTKVYRRSREEGDKTRGSGR